MGAVSKVLSMCYTPCGV